MQTNITERLLKRKDKHYETCKNLFDFLIILSCFTAGFSMTALAGDDNVAFSFTMKADMKKNYTGDRYRETTRTNNPWKVNMTASTEGKHTQAYYFLASNGIRRIQYSDQHLVKSETGDHCYKAYAEASKQGVSLGCKNNNDVNKSYTVSGYWDEETGGTIK